MRTRVVVLAVALALAAPGAADAAGSYSQVLKAYETYGSVPACQFTSPQLESALRSIDTYGALYFADFSNAVQAALAARASGSCSHHGKQAAGAVTTGRPNTGPPLHLEPVTAATGASLPAPILIMATLGAVLALLGTVAALAWWRGWSPRWAGAWGHAFSEAGYRARGTWSDFEDWLHSG